LLHFEKDFESKSRRQNNRPKMTRLQKWMILLLIVTPAILQLASPGKKSSNQRQNCAFFKSFDQMQNKTEFPFFQFFFDQMQ
jgi:hypothetical protein